MHNTRWLVFWGRFVGLIIALFWANIPANGADCYLVVVFDSTDPDISVSCKADAKNICTIFEKNVATSVLHIVSLPADDPQKLEDSLRELNANSTDTVIVYFSGHGFYDGEGQKLYFSKSGKNLTRRRLLDLIAEKRSRLGILISDCCNNFFKDEVQVERLEKTFGANITQQTSPLFEELVFSATGLVDITSSAEDELSLTSKVPSNGSVFTCELARTLKERQSDRLKWPELFSLVAQQTVSVSQQLFATLPPEAKQLKLRNGKDVVQVKQTPIGFQLGDGAPIMNQRPRLGVKIAAGMAGGKQMMIVKSVTLGSPAETQLGLEPGDGIVEINGRVLQTTDDFRDALQQSGKQMLITIRNVRNGETKQFMIELAY